MIRCFYQLYDRVIDQDQCADASAYLAIRDLDLLDADKDTLNEYYDDVVERSLFITTFYRKTTPYYANFCKTEDLYYNNFKDILIEFFKIHNIDYDILDMNIKILKEAQRQKLATGKYNIKNVFHDRYHPPEFFVKCLFDTNDPISLENFMNFLSNCKMSLLYLKGIDTKKYRNFIKLYTKSDEILAQLEKKEKITMVFRILPSFTPKDMFQLLHNLQFYF